jgi:hypothetical protein
VRKLDGTRPEQGVLTSSPCTPIVSAASRKERPVLKGLPPLRRAAALQHGEVHARHGLRYQDCDGDAIIALVPTFGPFPEVPEALRHLKNRYEIAIISSTPRTACSGRREGPRVALPDTFEYASKEIDAAPAQAIHVAQG